MTTNAGAQEMVQKTMGFESLPVFQDESKATKSLERVFTPEFRNRLDSIIYFKRLPSDILINLVDKEIHILSEALKEYSITIEVSHQAKLWLAEKGYNPEMGARPMGRLFDTALKQPISDLIINEEADTGDSILIDCLTDKLTFSCRKPVTVD
jgi:ATP-dependent Clp protease ATP-binding subunit ClpA